MLKELMQYVVGLAPATVFNDTEGPLYDKPVHRAPLPPFDPVAKPLGFASLTSFVQYLAANVDGLDLGAHVVHVLGPDEVQLISQLGGFHRQRETPVFAKYDAGPVANLLERWVDLETITIGLMSQFTAQWDRDTLLELLRSVKRESADVREDDGMSQKVNTKQGVKTLGVGKTANPYNLAPFRMFSEIEEQIVSPYIVRLRDGAAGLEVMLKAADGGGWRVAGARAVADRLKDLMAAEIVSAEPDPRVLW